MVGKFFASQTPPSPQVIPEQGKKRKEESMIKAGQALGGVCQYSNLVFFPSVVGLEKSDGTGDLSVPHSAMGAPE
jgi:hypothetical protein